MSRHRNVRSMNYKDEYDGYDDVYGHSVEDDYCISPSDDAAEFLYDRSRQPQMSAFFTEEDNIEEEDESAEVGQHEAGSKPPVLNDLDECKLRSCLDEIRNVIGESLPENILVEIIIKSDFQVDKALDTALSTVPSAADEKPAGVPKPQRTRKERERGKKKATTVVTPEVKSENKTSSCTNGVIRTTPVEEKSSPIPIKVVPPGAKTLNITKGFEISTEKGEEETHEGLKGSNTPTPRSQSPGSGRITPIGAEVPDPDVINKKALLSKESSKSRGRQSKVDPLAQYRQDRGDAKDHLHLVTIGHVDAGKSTLMGHLLFSMGQVKQKVMHKYEQESRKLGKQSFMYAWILDETGEERSRGITMDVGQSKFETPTKSVTLLDAPGHKDFIPNMITGAAQADVALLVVDATRGEFETGFESGGQTREHALLVRSLGVNQLGVVVNKLDTVNWSQERFQEIATKMGTFLRQAGFRETDVTFVPCSGLTGENLVSGPTEESLKKWYTGPCLLDVIENFRAPERPVSKPMRISVADVFKGTGSGFCISGRVETGMVQVGDKLSVLPQNETATVKALLIDDAPVQIAYAGDQVSATICGIEKENVNVGYVLCDPAKPIPVTTRFEARIVVFNIQVPITKGYAVIMHHHSLVEQVVVSKLVAQLHKSSGEVLKKHPRCLTRNTSGVIELESNRPICMELYRDVKELGRFMLRVGGVTIAAGLVTKIY
ncbi:protein HBS1 [Anabrus simplex]|uniref:protein HBS1 n=1 Tax=Anabrus simplex TaxID=316456 RepID=UPI0035A2D843